MPVAHRRRLDLVGDRERLRRLAEVPAGLEGRDVGVPDVGRLGEACRQEPFGGADRTTVEPGQQAEGEHVLGPAGILAAQPEALDRLDGQRGQVDRMHAVALERTVLERVGLVAGLGEVACGEVMGVDDERAARAEIAEVGAQRSRVHRHENVGSVAGSQDVVVGEVQLERRDPRQGARRGANLGREVGESGEVVAEGCRLLGESVAGELHAVPGVAGEADDHSVELLDLFGHCILNPERFAADFPAVSSIRR